MFKIITHFLYLLNAAMALDRLHYCKLFKLLIKRELRAYIYLGCLIILCIQTSVCITRDGAMSRYFGAINAWGCKQGRF
jgi:hypothetical protein